MTLVEGEELQRLWALVSELSSQLSANQQLCQSLQAQADELKGHALHSGTGYTLRRFNLDISKEKFDSDLEKVNAQLVMENHTLAHENKQVNVLLREYEQTLEQIMAKFRSFSHATQQHTLALTSHYETLLVNNVYDVASADLHVNTAFSEHLTRLGGLVRQALREVDGEGSADEGDEQEEGARVSEGYSVGQLSGGVASTSTSTPPKKVTKRSASGVADPRWYGSGGYTGLQGDPSAERARQALEVQTEEARLRAENEMLRELLRISADLTPDVAQQFSVAAPMPVNATAGWAAGMASTSAPKLSLGKPRGSRKSLGDILPSDDGPSSSASADITAEELRSSSSLTEHDGMIAEEDRDEEEERDEQHRESAIDDEEEGYDVGDFKPVDDDARSSARGPERRAQVIDQSEHGATAEESVQAGAEPVVSADIADQSIVGQGDEAETSKASSHDPVTEVNPVAAAMKEVNEAGLTPVDVPITSEERRSALLSETQDRLERTAGR